MGNCKAGGKLARTGLWTTGRYAAVDTVWKDSLGYNQGWEQWEWERGMARRDVQFKTL